MTDIESSIPGPALAKELSPVASRLLARAQSELQSGDAESAARTLSNVLSLAPDSAEGVRLMAIAAQNRGNHVEAVEYFRRALAVLPEDADLHIGLGVALYQAGEVNEAISHLRRACELAPESGSAWYNLAEALKPQVRTAEAIEALQRTLTLEPSHIPARLALARAWASLGRIDAAASDLREVLRMEPRHAEAWYALSNLKTVALDAGDVSSIEIALAQPELAPESRIWLGFALAKALEDRGDYARAFDVLHEANTLQRTRRKWDSAGERARVDAVMRVFADLPQESPDMELGREAILIASIPRSGSTLLEQILASHPEVEGANELKDLPQLIEAESHRRGSTFPLWVRNVSAAEWQGLGRRYLERTARWRRRKPRFTDKNLLNWVLAGAALMMLPGARVIVCRRAPLETCLACYRQWFGNEAAFACDLDDMADFCIDFVRLTRFWLARFPGRVFDLEYETLVADPEPTIRRLLDFCGLAFDPACVDFHKTERTVLSAPSAAQVRHPLRKDTARADRYGHKLDRLRARLRDAGL
ncbi:MAG TPA: sulfotransferase [Rhodanobacteraceae bacterium]|nr:sulfotransferase [Rhodanobacteraceae bacterium]